MNGVGMPEAEQQLMLRINKLQEKYGDLIIQNSTTNMELKEIEIYDDYRE